VEEVEITYKAVLVLCTLDLTYWPPQRQAHLHSQLIVVKNFTSLRVLEVLLFK